MGNSMVNNDIEQGIAAARNGDKRNAQIFLIQGLKQDKNNLEGWLWLARIVDDPSLRRRCVNVIQRLDPNNLEASFMLAELEKPLEQTVDKSVSPVSENNEASSQSTIPQKSSIKNSKKGDEKNLNKSIWRIFWGLVSCFWLCFV